MKDQIHIFLVVFVSLLVQTVYAQNLKNCKSFSRSLNGEATLSIDPRIEFFQIFNLIAGNPNISSVEMGYKTEIIDYFNKYKNHPSLRYYRGNFQNFFRSIDAPFSLLHTLELDFTFRKDVLKNRWKEHQEIDTLLSVFRHFAEDTDFARFFNAQNEFYNLLINNTAYTLSDFNESERMLTYYGKNDRFSHNFQLIINVLGMGNFGTGVKTKRQEEHYAVISPGNSISGIPIFSKQDIEGLIWHEFGHSFTNPLVDKYWSHLKGLSHLHEPVKQSMAAQAYPEWKTVLYEHLTRALACRFQANKYGEQYARQVQGRIETGRRFIYVAPIVELLRSYEQNRSLYPNLDSFMPQIIDRLEKISGEEIAKWNAEVEEARKPDVKDIPENDDVFERENQLMIFSTSEKDSLADQQLKAYASKIYPDIPTIDDTTALRMDLSKYNLFAIGSFEGNEFIREHLNLLPIHIDSTQLIAGKIYSGTGYAFITGWIHPQNPENVITFYIAQSPKDLLNFAWVNRGSTDYHIIKDLITLKADNYHRAMEIWMCE